MWGKCVRYRAAGFHGFCDNLEDVLTARPVGWARTEYDEQRL